jgi:cytochrome c oxidase subunit IV
MDLLVPVALSDHLIASRIEHRVLSIDNFKFIQMANNVSHTTDYKVLVKVVLVLMFLTFLTIFVTSLHLAAFSVTVALLIAGVKGFMILTYFMHLKYESLLLRILVAMIFVLYAVIILITFIDYAYR